MPTAKSVIKKIRGKGPPLKITDPMDIRLALAAAEMQKDEMYHRQLDIKRDHNFQLALAARAKSLELKAQEKERQEDISKTRLKNLKKARRKRMRNAESQ